MRTREQKLKYLREWRMRRKVAKGYKPKAKVIPIKQDAEQIKNIDRSKSQWVVLYKDNCIFSPPLLVEGDEVDGYINYFKGKSLQCHVVSSEKAHAVKEWLKRSHGRVHGAVINGVQVEPLFPACADMGWHEEEKIEKYQEMGSVETEDDI